MERQTAKENKAKKPLIDMFKQQQKNKRLQKKKHTGNKKVLAEENRNHTLYNL